jgi:hypothetical protein
MNRRLSSIAIGLVAAGSFAASLSSCNNVSCGPGTVQQQQKDGTLKCVEADSPQPLTPCDTDGGTVVIVGGRCISAIQCDPGTTMNENGICVGTGGTGMMVCSTPMPGTACVSGSILDFKTNMTNTVAPLNVDLYDPLALLTGGAPLATAVLDTNGGSYKFQNFPPPNLGLIVVMTGRGNANMTPAGTGAQGVTGGNQYRVDAYAIQKTDSDKWMFDISTGGAYIAKFYSDTKPAPNLLIANEKTPVLGVTLQKDGAPPAGTKYFDPTLTMVDSTLTATGQSGTAIVASPVMGSNFPTFSGSGPTAMPITWESLPGGSAMGVVIIGRFHPNM